MSADKSIEQYLKQKLCKALKTLSIMDRLSNLNRRKIDIFLIEDIWMAGDEDFPEGKIAKVQKDLILPLIKQKLFKALFWLRTDFSFKWEKWEKLTFFNRTFLISGDEDFPEGKIAKVEKDLVLPFLWAQDGFDEPSEEMAGKIAFGLKAPELLAMLGTVVFLVIGAILLLSCLVYLIWLKRSASHTIKDSS